MSNSHNQVLNPLAEPSFRRKPQLKGDTLVEVMFAVGIFGMVAIGAIGIMNKGLYDAQKALEITMARQEIDAQAEALRFLHDAYISEQNNHDLRQKPYSLIWNWLKYRSYKPSDPRLQHFFDTYNNVSCGKIYSENKAIPDPDTSAYGAKPFVINVRRVDELVARSYMNISGSATAVDYSSPSTDNGNSIIVNYNRATNMFEQSPTYPRLLFTNTYTATSNVHDTEENLSNQEIDSEGHDASIYYTTLTKSQGIWVTSIASAETNPEFYDFYIRTCWDSPGSGTSTTISTTVRLFNPDYR